MDLNEPPYRNLETRTKSIINGVPVLIRATHEGTDVEYPDPLAFGQKVAHLRKNLHSGSTEVSQLVNEHRMRDLFYHYPNESAKPSVYAVQMINENYGRQVGKMSPVFNASPLEDCLMIFSRPGVAGIISADGITSNWWRNRYILKHLAGSNPPLDLAKKASIQFMLNVVQFAGRPQIEDADFSNAFSNVSDGIAIEAENLLTGFAKTELTSSNREIPVSMTAGTTLNAAIYYENVGLVLFNYGDGFVIQGNHKLECEKTTMPFLGESQTVKDGIAAFVRSSVINPQILIIPQKELMEDALLWVGVDGARDFILSGLTPETIYGKFSDKAIAEIKARALLFTGDTKPQTDITVAISSPYQLKLLAEKSTEAKQLYLP